MVLGWGRLWEESAALTGVEADVMQILAPAKDSQVASTGRPA